MADNPDMVDKRIADNNSNITINSNLNNNSSSNENNNKDNNNSSNNNSNNHSNNQNNPYHDKRNKIDGDGDGENASERSPLLSSLIISDEEEVKDNIPSLWYWRNWGALFLLGMYAGIYIHVCVQMYVLVCMYRWMHSCIMYRCIDDV